MPALMPRNWHAHDLISFHLVVYERKQAAAQQASFHVCATQMEQRAAPLGRRLWR